MSDSISFSLILCTYGRTHELERLFRSLAAQSFRDFEIIVVDQNRDTRIQQALERARTSGLSLRHVRLDYPNLSAARNAGLRLARGTWVGFPDDDCWYEPDLLEKMHASLAAAPALSGIVARWAELEEPASLPLRYTWERTRLFRDRQAISFMLFFDRRLFNHIGGFDARLGVGQWFGAGEETDFVMRALHAGVVMEFLPSAVVHHPFKEPVKSAQGRASVRHRARGTGALYVKHRLPARIVLRGLIAPLLRPLLRPRRSEGFINGCMTSWGRLEGFMHWRRQDPHAAVIGLHLHAGGTDADQEQVPALPREAKLTKTGTGTAR